MDGAHFLSVPRREGMREAMARYQSGHIFEGHGAMHVRYVTEIVDGQLKRTQRSERLRAKDNKRHSVTCMPVKQLAAQVMDASTLSQS